MKKLALAFAVLAVLVVGSGVPAWAESTITNTSTVGSLAFGFAPTSTELVRMHHVATLGGVFGAGGISQDLVSTCTGTAATGFTCGFDNNVTPGNGYITRNGADCTGTTGQAGNCSLPGAYTSSPMMRVSFTPDWGCGVDRGTATCDDDGAENVVDYVLQNNVSIGNSHPGQNTAPGTGSNISDPTTCGIPSITCTDGTLVGSFTSVVNINSTGEDGMPSGSITFTRDPNAGTGCQLYDGSQAGLGCSDVNISQALDQTVAGLYTFGHTDVSDVPFDSVAARGYNNADGGQLLTGVITALLPGVIVRSITTVSQEAMGGDATSSGGTDTLTWGTLWTNNGGHPGGGNLLAPGLNVGNWAGDAGAVLGPSSADANGFR